MFFNIQVEASQPAQAFNQVPNCNLPVWWNLSLKFEVTFKEQGINRLFKSESVQLDWVLGILQRKSGEKLKQLIINISIIISWGIKKKSWQYLLRWFGFGELSWSPSSFIFLKLLIPINFQWWWRLYNENSILFSSFLSSLSTLAAHNKITKYFWSKINANSSRLINCEIRTSLLLNLSF